MAEQAEKVRKLDGVDLTILLLVAAIFDLASVIPVIGSVFGPLGILVLRIIFFFMGVRTKAINASPVVGAIIEAIPVIEIIPSSVLYVLVTYFETVYLEKAARKIPGGQAALSVASGKIKKTAPQKPTTPGRGPRQKPVPGSRKQTEEATSKPVSTSNQAQQFSDTDQYGQRRGPQDAGGQVSTGPYAQPDQNKPTPRGQKPSHPVLKARERTTRPDKQSSDTQSETRSSQPRPANRARDPRFDQYGNIGPIPETSPVAGNKKSQTSSDRDPDKQPTQKKV